MGTAGGVLVLTEEAVSWAAQNGISEVKFKKLKSPVDSTQKLSYTEREQIDGHSKYSVPSLVPMLILLIRLLMVIIKKQ
jgi:hypothetical protein